jgi:predicted NUDIX family NTP pyrophosphohydrolase
MAKRDTVSAGLLLYHRLEDELEVLLAHPGGPFWAHRDAGAWSTPKGLVDKGEAPLVREPGHEMAAWAAIRNHPLRVKLKPQ